MGFMKVILKNSKSQTEEFKKINDSEPWTTKSKRSQGWHPLYDLLITAASKEKLLVITLDDVQQSVPCFSCYELSAFKRYYHDMLTLTGEKFAACATFYCIAANISLFHSEKMQLKLNEE